MLAREGRLPVAADCWQCYHPPLFYLLGWPLYAAVGLPWLAVSAAVATYYGYRLLRRFGCRGASLAGGTALLLTFPCLVMGTAFTRRFVWAAAVTSALISLVTFRPSLPENSREPTRLATFLWTRLPAWNNPLPEVFSETQLHVDDL